MRRRTAGLALLATLLAAPPAKAVAAEPSPLFGVNAQAQPGDADFKAMQDGGVGTYRWLVSWPAIQPNPGSAPDWSGTDRTMTEIAEQGLRPLPMIQGSPCGVVDCTKPKPPVANSQPPIGTPRGRLAWAGFVGSLVHRYGPDGEFWDANPDVPYQPVSTWQIWNEQNAPQFYRPTPSVEGYAELLRIASQEIRSRDPDAQILLGGMFGYPSADGAIFAADFLDRLYDIPGVSNYFNGVAVHPYAPDLDGVEAQISDVRRVLDAHGAGATPIWITEIGWGTSRTGEGRLVETIDGQAEMLTKVLGALEENRRRLNIAGVMWFSWRDTSGKQEVCDWCPTSGLIASDGEAKPAWGAYAELTGGRPVAPAEVHSGSSSGSPWRWVALAALAALAVLAALLVARAWRTRRQRAR